MLAKEIIDEARLILSDVDSDRWSDARLISLLNNCLKDLSKNTILFTNTGYAAIVDQVVDYDLALTTVKIHRIEYNDEPLKMLTFEEMDKKKYQWQLDTGDKPTAIIYNKQNQGQFKIYPIVSNAQDGNIVFSQSYGIVTAITYSDLEILFSDILGDLGSYVDTGTLKIFYTRKHVKITDINDVVNLDDLILSTIAHYIAGHALRDNGDVQNRIVGNEELQMYKDDIIEYSAEKAKNFGNKIYEVGYDKV